MTGTVLDAAVVTELLWSLRDNVTAYDATYVALAEALGAELLTTDRRLAEAAAGLATCDVIVVS